jgi:hypothetical protein
MDRLATAFEPWSCGPDDGDDVRARKAQFTLAMTLIVPAGLVWAALYAAFGAWTAALMPLGYSVLTAINLVILHQSRHFRWFQVTELILILAVPFALQIVLGGYVGGSAVVSGRCWGHCSQCCSLHRGRLRAGSAHSWSWWSSPASSSRLSWRRTRCPPGW